MSKGIKESKTALFNIDYEMYPQSCDQNGYVYMQPDESDYYYYITGAGINELPMAVHSPVNAEKIGRPIEVYLEDNDTLKQNVWNKELNEGLFSHPISSISYDEVGDLELKAKWCQYIYQSENMTYQNSSNQSNLELSKDDLLFEW